MGGSGGDATAGGAGQGTPGFSLSSLGSSMSSGIGDAGSTPPPSFSPFLDTIQYQPSQVPSFGQVQQQQDPLQQLLAYIRQGGGI